MNGNKPKGESHRESTHRDAQEPQSFCLNSSPSSGKWWKSTPRFNHILSMKPTRRDCLENIHEKSQKGGVDVSEKS